MGARLERVLDRRQEILEVARRHHVSRVSVFGSVARGDDREGSDIDFLVTFEPGSSLTDLMALEDDLLELLQCPVDVVSEGGLKPRDEHIRREAVAL